jgi:hypothetical protein
VVSNISRERHVLALKEQEKLAAEMAPGEVALANGMAIKCIETKFLECDY